MWLSLEFSRTYYSSCVLLFCLFENFHNKNFIHIYVYNMSRASLVAQMVKNLPAVWETQVQSLDWEDSLEKGMSIHYSILAWRIP